MSRPDDDQGNRTSQQGQRDADPDRLDADLREYRPRPSYPASTYRVQLTSAFPLSGAAAILPYLARLGVDTCYTSPYLIACRNSASGYDVCDPRGIQPELGGDDGFLAFVDALRRAGLGHMFDVVPNHMGTDPARNAWWRDVLMHGPRSTYADAFDIDWQPVKAELRNRLLLPLLGTQYGAALEDGSIALVVRNDEPVIAVGNIDLPIDPESAVDVAADRVDAGRLHALLERQVYRLAYWRTASDEINYRRFFDVDGLVGVRMEDEPVFDAAHELVLRLVREGIVTSLRVDHPDGLARPDEYFARLSARLAPRTVHIVAEKILTAGEDLPEDWAVDGTTGYEFLNAATGVFEHPDGAATLQRDYAGFASVGDTFEGEAYRSRKTVMATTLASEVEMLAARLNRISEQHPRSRDFTLNNLRRAVVELVAHLGVYRTYITDEGARPEDVARIRDAARAARWRQRTLEPSVFRFLESVMLGPACPEGFREYPAASPRDERDRRVFTARLQQFAASVFAKGIEDTACYRYQPMLSANEVGGNPARLGVPVEVFHAQNASRVSRPGGLSATATHDSKFGEDTRARLAVLSELADEWRRQVKRWRRQARQPIDAEGARAVDPNDAYRLYQALVGTWPCATDREPLTADYERRIVEFMRKSVREAKVHTSWLNPNDEYEQVLEACVRDTIAHWAGARRHGTPEFVHRVARAGVVNSLAQLVLKAAAPGVADIYQGTELWDLTLVDPDNRRPVDFARRASLLADLEPLIEQVGRRDAAAAREVGALLDDWPTGRIKLFVMAAALRMRRAWRDVFISGAYRPLGSEDQSDVILAFHRQHGDRDVVAVVPRFVAGWTRRDGQWPVGERVWGGRTLAVPPHLEGRAVWNALTGEIVHPFRRDGQVVVLVRDLLSHSPVGLWCAGEIAAPVD